VENREGARAYQVYLKKRTEPLLVFAQGFHAEGFDVDFYWKRSRGDHDQEISVKNLYVSVAELVGISST